MSSKTILEQWRAIAYDNRQIIINFVVLGKYFNIRRTFMHSFLGIRTK